MSVDDIVKLFDAITKLLNVLICPGVLLFILIRFGRNLREFFSSLGERSLKEAGFEASLKRKQAEVAAALSAAAVTALPQILGYPDSSMIHCIIQQCQSVSFPVNRQHDIFLALLLLDRFHSS